MATFVLNPRYGGFELSDEALKQLGWCRDARFLVLEKTARSDPKLVRVCKELGAKASTDDKPFELVYVDEPDIPYVRFSEYDGLEKLNIDEYAKANGTQAKILAAIRAVMTTQLNDAEKLTIITALLK